MRFLVIPILLTLLLCSCSSRIPEPISYEYSQQHKMQASNHWQVLAADLANRINNQLIMTDHLDEAVLVQETCGDETTACEPYETTSFNEAFRDLLITNLFNYGVPTKSRGNGKEVEVHYKVQTIHHNSKRIRTLQPGILSSLSATVMVLRNAPSELILLAAGAAADLANTSLVSSGQYEIIITTSMISGDKYLFRASDIYYINDRDFHHYQQNRSQTATIKITSK